jgi:thioredoxin 2
MTQIPCANCGAVNRISPGKPLSEGKCGRCHQALFKGAPIDVDGPALDRFRRSTQGAAVLLDVWAPWCGPCRTMAPHFAQAAKQLEPDVLLLKLDSEAHPDAAAKLGVQSIPALFLFRDGKTVAKQAGALTAVQLMAWVKSALG